MTLATAISDRIRSEILSGKKKPGTKLRLDEIKAEFGVSWSPIREGLSRLLAEGLVTTEDQRGFRVAPVSKAHLADIIGTRIALESMALRTSIEQGDDAWEAELLSAHHRLSKFETRRWEGRELDEWEVWHRTYHEALIRGCGSPILLQFCNMLHDMNYRYRRLFLDPRAGPRRGRGASRDRRSGARARRREGVPAARGPYRADLGRNILQSMSDGRRRALRAAPSVPGQGPVSAKPVFVSAEATAGCSTGTRWSALRAAYSVPHGPKVSPRRSRAASAPGSARSPRRRRAPATWVRRCSACRATSASAT